MEAQAYYVSLPSPYFTDHWLSEISVLGSWDAEEYGMVGSTEWVEEFVTWAVPNMVAYVNVDVAVSGSHFHLQAVPELWDLVEDTIKDTSSPKTPGKSIYDEWSADKGVARGT